ncbi:MAG: 2OG-Fe(II) oxygenase [Coxiellaceae bacterium]|nr:2OG-Fe(II) oxygenase [Coxiellaceae bacterium]
MRDRMAAISDMVANIEPKLNAIELKLSDQLKQDQENVDVIWRLAENYRKQGNLSQALGGYQRLLQLQPDHHKAEYLRRILSGESIMDFVSEEDFPASPFALTDNFLTTDQQQLIWQLLEKNYQHFDVSKTLDKKGQGQLTDYRSSQLLPQKHLKPLRKWFLSLIVEQLNHVLPRIGLESFEISGKELQLTKSQGGDYYKIHSDRGGNSKSATRNMTFVYYFHGEPKGFSGGDLLLFDTHAKKKSFNAHFTRVSPINNRLICFPSDRYHTVLPVKSLVDDWQFARFTLNGWLHQVSEK